MTIARYHSVDVEKRHRFAFGPVAISVMLVLEVYADAASEEGGDERLSGLGDDMVMEVLQ